MNDCIFCKIVSGEAGSWKVYEDDSVYAFFDINPVNEYHTLVVPKKHYENIFDIPEEELVQVMRGVKRLAVFYRNKLDIHHVQIIHCAGSEAQQDVFHMHVHIIPRKKGDGQDVKWTTHPEWVKKFDLLLERVK